MASIGIFLPVYLFTIVPAPWFKRHRDNPQLKAFVDGATACSHRRDHRRGSAARRTCYYRCTDSNHRAGKSEHSIAIQSSRTNFS